MLELSERELWQFFLQTHRKHGDYVSWDDWCLERGYDERNVWED